MSFARRALPTCLLADRKTEFSLRFCLKKFFPFF